MATQVTARVEVTGWHCGRHGCDVLHRTRAAAEKHAAKPVARVGKHEQARRRFRMAVDYCRGMTWRQAARNHGYKSPPSMFSALVDIAECVLVGPWLPSGSWRVTDAFEAAHSGVWLRNNASAILPRLRTLLGADDYLAEELEACRHPHAHAEVLVRYRVRYFNVYAGIQGFDVETLAIAERDAQWLAEKHADIRPIIGELAEPYTLLRADGDHRSVFVEN